jgi:hypothetical protein
MERDQELKSTLASQLKGSLRITWAGGWWRAYDRESNRIACGRSLGALLLAIDKGGK